MRGRLAAALLAVAAAATGGPLTHEDVVRLVAAGTPEAEILEAIATREAAYDLSEEMVEELRLAGVPEAVIAAMRARHPAASPTPAALRPIRGKVRLTVTLAGAETLSVPRRVPDALGDRLRLPAEGAARDALDLAVFLACVTAEHVPDQWRSKSPLGRDLEGMPRHEMLLFHAGDTPAGAKPTLTLPSELDADVEDVEPHDVVLGVAARIGDRWRALGYAKKTRVEVKGGAPRLSGRIVAAGAPFGFKVELSEAQTSSETSLETPASSIVTP